MKKRKFFEFGGSFFAPRTTSERLAQADVKYSRPNKKYQVVFDSHHFLSHKGERGERWFATRKLAETFAKRFVFKHRVGGKARPMI